MTTMRHWLIIFIALFAPGYPVLASHVTWTPPTVAEAEVQLPREVELLPAATSPPAPLTILTAVARGRELLAPVLVDFKAAAMRLKPLPSLTTPVAVALAVWDKKTDTVRVVGGTRNQKQWWSDDGTLTLPRIGGTGVLAGYRGNDPDLVVVGAVQPNVNYIRKGRYGLEYAYYVPYNRTLYAIETLTAGSDYLSLLIQGAFDSLREKGIRSRAFPDQLVADVIDPYLVKAIAVIEHADGQIYETDGSEDSLGRFLVKLGVNRDVALSPAVSTAGASGLVQFIPSTYKLMVTKRPDLGLIPDFAAGMADHRNAVTAEVAYLDMELAALQPEIRALYQEDRGKAAEFLAAAYNGGSPRVRRAFATLGDDWAKDSMPERLRLYQVALDNKARMERIDAKLAAGGLGSAEVKKLKAEKQIAADARYLANQKRAVIKSAALYKETVGYVVKLRRVYDMLAAGYFATPAATAATPLAIAPTP
jgi:hypothetical protein